MEEKKVNNEENRVPNSEILFLYDCKECNPNGDPDNENRPRMDYLKEKVLVSDVRLKRYVRDYFQNRKGMPIFVSKVKDRTVDATDRFAYFIAELLLKPENQDKLKKINFKEGEKSNIETLKDKIKKDEKWDLIDIDDFLKYFIDVRLFGVTLPIKGTNKKGRPVAFTGPVQFNWGYSLNKAELIESPTITSHFAGKTKEGDEETGTIGKDWRVYYALVAFYGRISGNSAKKTLMSIEDLKELDEALWKSIITETNTRTKLNQQPRFFIRVEYKDSETFIGDLRRYIDIDRKEGLRDVGEYTLDISRLVEKLGKKKEAIDKIFMKVDEDISVKGLEELRKLFNGLIEELE